MAKFIAFAMLVLVVVVSEAGTVGLDFMQVYSTMSYQHVEKPDSYETKNFLIVVLKDYRPLVDDPGCFVTFCWLHYWGNSRWYLEGTAEHYSSTGVSLSVTLSLSVRCTHWLGYTLCSKCSNSGGFLGIGKVSGSISCYPAGSDALCYKSCSCSSN
ncbi:MAG: hypothetical protein J7J80_02820 [Thermotogae bacterium]|nr:hypothetical protein [Thermotogota bacterium]